MTRPVETDDHLWASLYQATRSLNETPAEVLLRIESGELRSRDTERGIYVMAEDLMTVWRAQLARRRTTSRPT